MTIEDSIARAAVTQTNDPMGILKDWRSAAILC